MKLFKIAALVESNDQFIPATNLKAHVWKLFNTKRQAKRAGAWSIRKVMSVNYGPCFFRSWTDGSAILVIER